MRATAGQVAGWLGLYVALAVLPLGVALLGPLPPARGFWVELGVALGFVGLAMLVLQFALTARFDRIAAPFGQDTLLHFHRQAGLVAFALILAHPLVLFAAEPAYLEFLDPRVSAVRAFALAAVLAALVLLIATTIWRRPLGMSYEWWRTGHGLLALMVVFLGVVHLFRVGYYTAGVVKIGFWVVVLAIAAALLVQSRVVRPLRMWRRPYRVIEVRPEIPGAWTLALTPEGHPGMRFEPGQFCWLTVGDSPFSLQQHPFSLASSALSHKRIELTIKELGDFTATVGDIAPGTRAWLEGPYGAFTLNGRGVRGAVFLVGGVGITPVISMLRTLAEIGDRRPLLLIYANRSADTVLFRDELERWRQALDLEIVHVLEDPPPDWHGERGLLDEALLGRLLARERIAADEFLVCGPDPMMDTVEGFLLDAGVPLRRLRSERFNIA